MLPNAAGERDCPALCEEYWRLLPVRNTGAQRGAYALVRQPTFASLYVFCTCAAATIHERNARIASVSAFDFSDVSQ